MRNPLTGIKNNNLMGKKKKKEKGKKRSFIGRDKSVERGVKNIKERRERIKNE